MKKKENIEDLPQEKQNEIYGNKARLLKDCADIQNARRLMLTATMEMIRNKPDNFDDKDIDDIIVTHEYLVDI